MSLVEKALRKLQESGKGPSAPPTADARAPGERPETLSPAGPPAHAHGPMVPIER